LTGKFQWLPINLRQSIFIDIEKYIFVKGYNFYNKTLKIEKLILNQIFYKCAVKCFPSTCNQLYYQ
jgi:hypothetical protein